MKACAEKHVVEALAIQERVNNPKTPDVVESALEYLSELDRCPGPKCNVPFEHTGIYIHMYMESVHSIIQCRWMCSHVLPQLQNSLLFVVQERHRR